ILVISSPSSSTTGLATLIFAILDSALPWDGTRGESRIRAGQRAIASAEAGWKIGLLQTFGGPFVGHKAEAPRKLCPGLPLGHGPDHGDRRALAAFVAHADLGNVPVQPGRAPTPVGVAKLQDRLPDRLCVLPAGAVAAAPQ